MDVTISNIKGGTIFNRLMAFNSKFAVTFGKMDTISSQMIQIKSFCYSLAGKNRI